MDIDFTRATINVTRNDDGTTLVLLKPHDPRHSTTIVCGELDTVNEGRTVRYITHAHGSIKKTPE